MKDVRAHSWKELARDADPALVLEALHYYPLPPPPHEPLSVTLYCGSRTGLCVAFVWWYRKSFLASVVCDPGHMFSISLKNKILFFPFLFSLYLFSPWFHYLAMCFPLRTKKRPFSWVTVSFRCVVIGSCLLLRSLGNCTESSVATLGNCESLTAVKVNLFAPLMVRSSHIMSTVWQEQRSQRIQSVDWISVQLFFW